MRLREIIQLFEKVAPQLIDLLGQHDLFVNSSDAVLSRFVFQDGQIFDAVTISGNADDESMMDDPVDDRARQDLITEDLCPVFEVSIRGENGGFGFTALTDDLEEVIEYLRRHFTEAHLVDDQQISGTDLLE